MEWGVDYTNHLPSPRGGAVPDPVCVGLKLLLAFPRVQVTQGTPRAISL